MKNSLLILMLLIAAFSINLNSQIIVNGDFEAWTGSVPDSWTIIDAGISVDQETTTVHGGTSAMNVWVTTATQSNTDFRQDVPVTNGSVYDISLWVYQIDSASRVTLFIDGVWTNIYSDPTVLNSWQEVTYQYTATATASVPIGLRFYDVPGTFTDSANVIIDDFTMTDVSGSGTNPYVTNIVLNPVSPTDQDPVSVTADITDNGTIVSAYLYWSLNGVIYNDSISMSVLSGDTYQTDTSIPAQPAGTVVYYFIKAIDNDSEEGTSPNYTYVIPYGVPFGSCENLFFSEYIEGSSFNKVLEIYNPKNVAVDLSNYSIQKFNNGNTTANSTFVLAGTLAAGDVFVIANTDADSASILTLADTIVGFPSHNGNETYVLFNFVDTIDIFGKIGESATFDIDTVVDGAENYTLIRKPAIQQGQFNWTIGNTEWIVMPLDYIADLGMHTMNACQVNVENLSPECEINIFPNPVNETLNFVGLDNEKDITITNISGQMVDYFYVSGSSLQYSVSRLERGLYFAVIRGKDNNIKRYKFIKE